MCSTTSKESHHVTRPNLRRRSSLTVFEESDSVSDLLVLDGDHSKDSRRSELHLKDNSRKDHPNGDEKRGVYYDKYAKNDVNSKGAKIGNSNRRSHLRTAALIASALFFLFALSNWTSFDTPRFLTQITSRRTNQINEINELQSQKELQTQNEIRTLLTRLKEKEIELAWEHQHVSDLEEKEHMTAEELSKAREEEKKLKFATGAMNNLKERNGELGVWLEIEERENEKLKKALQQAMEDMAIMGRALEKHNLRSVDGADGGGKGSGGNSEGSASDGDDGRLYHLGDSVEVFEDQDGKTALRPGVIIELHKDEGEKNDKGGDVGGATGTTDTTDTTDTTFTIMDVERNQKLYNMKANQFQKYHAYPKGTRVYYYETKDQFVGATVDSYVDRPGKSEANSSNGHYRVIFDADHVLQEVQANRLFRYLEETS